METEKTNAGSTPKSNSLITAVRNLLPNQRTALGEKKPWYKLPLAKRIVYLVLSLLIAVLLWGFVLMTQNPDRERTFTNIKPNFESGAEADLIARQLTVCGALSNIIEGVSVTINAPLTEVSKVVDSNITATISLNNVSKAGVYELEIKASSTIGTVTRVEPSTVEIEIDDLVSNTIPITYYFKGDLPEGYWRGEPELVTNTVVVEGAKQDVLKAAKAVLFIDLTDLTENVNRSYQLDVQDSDGNVLDKSVFKRVVPAVTVRMTVLPHKHVPIVYDLVTDDISEEIFEIDEQWLNIEYLDIAAPADELSEVTEISCDPIRLAGITEPGSYQYSLTLYGIPENAVIVGGVNISSIRLNVTVVEKKTTVTMQDVPILFVGESENFNYHYGFTTVTVIITGPVRLMQAFASSDFSVIVNVEGTSIGEYDIALEYKLYDYDTFGDIEILLSERAVHASITNHLAMN